MFINRSVFTCLRVCLRVFACLFTKKNGACLRLRVCLRKKLARVYVCVFVYEKNYANMFACLHVCLFACLRLRVCLLDFIGKQTRGNVLFINTVFRKHANSVYKQYTLV